MGSERAREREALHGFSKQEKEKERGGGADDDVQWSPPQNSSPRAHMTVSHINGSSALSWPFARTSSRCVFSVQKHSFPNSIPKARNPFCPHTYAHSQGVSTVVKPPEKTRFDGSSLTQPRLLRMKRRLLPFTFEQLFVWLCSAFSRSWRDVRVPSLSPQCPT